MNGLDPTYLTENNVSINGHESSLASVLYDVPKVLYLVHFCF